MRALVRIGYVAAALAAISTAAPAADVMFQGTLASVCVLGLPTQGGLIVDGEGRLTSQGAIGLGSITVLTTGGNRLRVTPPVWDLTPLAYTPGGETFEYSYTGLAGLGVVDSGWISTATNIALPVLPLSVLVLNARATTPGNGWVDGTYRMKVVVTCSTT